MGLLYDGFIMPPQSTLPDRDSSKWELGLSGEPDDPWQHQMCLVLQSPGTHELGTFATSSRTGRRAVGNLLGTTIACARRTTIITPSSGSRSPATTTKTKELAGCTRRSLPLSARRRRRPPLSRIRHLVATSNDAIFQVRIPTYAVLTGRAGAKDDSLGTTAMRAPAQMRLLSSSHK